MSKLRSTIYRQQQTSLKKKRYRFITEESGRRSLQLPRRQTNIANSRKQSCQANPSNQQLKDKLYHRNFSQYKLLFEGNNVATLPFILSLRQSNQTKHKTTSLTNLEPFDVADKQTINQKMRKSINDIEANPTRVFQASYRWKRKNGYDTRISCEFQTSLRQSSGEKAPLQSHFVNIIKPTRYKNIQQRKYNLKELLCEHQKKIFVMQG